MLFDTASESEQKEVDALIQKHGLQYAYGYLRGAHEGCVQLAAALAFDTPQAKIEGDFEKLQRMRAYAQGLYEAPTS